jgi:hypothetical protein
LQREFGIILESALAKVNLSSSMLTKRAWLLFSVSLKGGTSKGGGGGQVLSLSSA